MCRKWIFPALFLLALTLVPGLLRAQSGPGPRAFGGRGFGGRVLDVEGCLSSGWRGVPSGTPGYAVQITRRRLEPRLNESPVMRTSTELAYRDNTGITYQQITLPAFGSSGMPRTVICIYDPNLHIRLVVNPANMTAREYQLPTRMPSGNYNSNNSNRSSPRPPRPQTQDPNVLLTHPAPPAELASEISTYCPDATDTKIVRGAGQNVMTTERVDCPSLRLELHSHTSGPRGDSSSTAMITATGSGVNLASLSVPYPLPANYAVTVVTPGSRGNRRFNGGAAQSSPQ